MKNIVAYSVVPRVKPKLEDLSDELRREEGRLKDRRDPCEVGLLVPFESASVSDSIEVRARAVGRDLSARAEKERPRTAKPAEECKAERCPPVIFS